MAVLRSSLLVAAIAATGCYEPEFRECVVACAQDSDCGPGQVCGEDRLCLQPSSRRCEREVIDAGADAPPRPPVDAHVPPPDAPPPPPPRYPLTVKVSGEGSVLVPGFAACRDECTYQVLGGPISLEAIPDDDSRHDKWGEACEGTDGTTCMLVVTSAVLATAKFRED